MAHSISFNNKLYYLTFFLCGLNLSYLYLPFLLLCFISDFPKYIVAKFTWRFFSVYFSMISFVIVLFCIGYTQLSMEKPYRVFMILSFLVTILGLVLNSSELNARKNMLTAYLLGMSCQTLAVILFSYYKDPVIYGYSKLLDPFSGEVINSPSVSNNLSLLAIFLTTMLTQNLTIAKKIGLISLLILVFYFAIFLGGRTFFIVFVIAFFIIFSSKMGVSIVLKSGVLILLVLFIFKIFLSSEHHFQLIEERFSSGLKSDRFGHYLYALTKIPYYPFGGFGVDTKLENTRWLHNVIFDSARVAGWIPVLLFIFYTFYSVICYVGKNKISVNQYGFVFFVSSFLLMQQDVIVEGNYRLLLVYFFSTILMIGENNAINRSNYKL